MIDYLEQGSGQADALEEQRRRLAAALTSAAAAGESGGPEQGTSERTARMALDGGPGETAESEPLPAEEGQTAEEMLPRWRRRRGWTGSWTAPRGSGRTCWPQKPEGRAGRPGEPEVSPGDSRGWGTGEMPRRFGTGPSRRRAGRGPLPEGRTRRRSGSRPETWTGSFSGTAAGMTGAFSCIDEEERR